MIDIAFNLWHIYDAFDFIIVMFKKYDIKKSSLIIRIVQWKSIIRQINNTRTTDCLIPNPSRDNKYKIVSIIYNIL